MARRQNPTRPAAPGRQDTDTWVEVRGVVVRLLHDDEDRHQRFVIDIGGGKTLLVAHNLEIAERVPLGIGDRVRVRGLYEWNDLGGLLHWTHADPMAREDAGYIRLQKTTFQ